jgi:vanadium-dependent haloperoxidase-like protein
MQGIKVLTAAAALALCLASSRAHADVITEWNLAATTATALIGSPAQARALATAHGAAFEAANAIQPRYAAYLKTLAPPPDTSPDAAAASAMYVVLSTMVPAQKSAFEGAYKSILGKITEGEAKERGVAFGGEVAKLFLEVRANDGMNATAEYKPLTGPGQWKPTPPAEAPMALPNLANVLPFTTKTFGFLKVEGPPALDSAAYAGDVDEVRQVGSRNSTTRTADQTASAIFWYITTPVPWQAAARAAAQKINLGLVDSARSFALMNMAGADAYIAGWQIKQKTNFWRPITAIREGIRNPDPSWEPLLGTPPHPDYPSAHNIYSGATAEVIRRLIGIDQLTFSSVLALPTGPLVRSWNSLSEAEKDVIGARIWAGIHFRTADEHGIALGHAIAENAVDTVMRPLAR